MAARPLFLLRAFGTDGRPREHRPGEPEIRPSPGVTWRSERNPGARGLECARVRLLRRARTVVSRRRGSTDRRLRRGGPGPAAPDVAVDGRLIRQATGEPGATGSKTKRANPRAGPYENPLPSRRSSAPRFRQA